MSRAKRLAIRGIERDRGRPMTDHERDDFERLWAEFERFCSAAWAEDYAQMAAYTQSPYVVFMRQLQARQGTFMPDFDALYRRKAELDNDRP